MEIASPWADREKRITIIKHRLYVTIYRLLSRKRALATETRNHVIPLHNQVRFQIKKYKRKTPQFSSINYTMKPRWTTSSQWVWPTKQIPPRTINWGDDFHNINAKRTPDYTIIQATFFFSSSSSLWAKIKAQLYTEAWSRRMGLRIYQRPNNNPHCQCRIIRSVRSSWCRQNEGAFQSPTTRKGKWANISCDCLLVAWRLSVKVWMWKRNEIKLLESKSRKVESFLRRCFQRPTTTTTNRPKIQPPTPHLNLRATYLFPQTFALSSLPTLCI